MLRVNTKESVNDYPCVCFITHLTRFYIILLNLLILIRENTYSSAYNQYYLPENGNLYNHYLLLMLLMQYRHLD